MIWYVLRTLSSRARRSQRGPGDRRGGPDPRLLRFARGLAIGALVGAAIAGSGLWRRGRQSDEDRS